MDLTQLSDQELQTLANVGNFAAMGELARRSNPGNTLGEMSAIERENINEAIRKNIELDTQGNIITFDIPEDEDSDLDAYSDSELMESDTTTKEGILSKLNPLKALGFLADVYSGGSLRQALTKQSGLGILDNIFKRSGEPRPDYQYRTPGYTGQLIASDLYDPKTRTNRFDRAKTLFGQSRNLVEYFQKKKAERARKAAKLDKSSPNNFGAIGNTLAGVGKVKEAITFYKKALTIAPHAETWIKIGYINALSSIKRFDEAKIIANEISENDQFVAYVRGQALAMLAYIAFKEDNSKLAKTYINQFKLLDFQMNLEGLINGLWNLKSNQEFIQDYRKVVSDLGVN